MQFFIFRAQNLKGGTKPPKILHFKYFLTNNIDNQNLINSKMSKTTSKKSKQDQDYRLYTETNKRRKLSKKYIVAGCWTNKENQIYLNFLQTNPKLFENQFIRRSTKVFRKMSYLIKRRDPQQCRSHHQKLSIRFNGDIDLIIEHLKQKIYCQNDQQGEVIGKESEQEKEIGNKENKNQIKTFETFTGNKISRQPNSYNMSFPTENRILVSINMSEILGW